MRRRFLLVLTALVTYAAIAAGYGGPGGPAVAAQAGTDRILFVSDRAGPRKFDIWTMAPDGSDPVNLTSSEEAEFDPVWSPDRKQISYVSVKPGRLQDVAADLWVMNADGSNRRQLTKHPKGTIAHAPSWSPDGKRLVFAVMAGWPNASLVQTELYLIDVTGQNAKTLARGLFPSWSPDGKNILYTGTDEQGSLQLVSPVSGKPKLLLKQAAMGSWSHDGQRIVYVNTAAALAIGVADADGKNARSVTGPGLNPLAPHWSHGDRQILFTNAPQRQSQLNQAEVYAVESDGKNERRLTNNKNFDMAGSGFMLVLGSGSPQGSALFGPPE